MKVLKTTDTSKWSHTFTCGQCDSQLQAERGDIKYQHYSGDQRDPSYDTWTVECPICQYPHTILAEDIPKALQVQIKNNKFPSPGTFYANEAFLDLSDGKEHPWQKRD